MNREDKDYRHPLVRRFDLLDRVVDEPDNVLDKFWYKYMTKNPLWWHLATWPVWTFASIVRTHDDNDPVIKDKEYAADLLVLVLLAIWLTVLAFIVKAISIYVWHLFVV